jgi:hypothetical protein
MTTEVEPETERPIKDDPPARPTRAADVAVAVTPRQLAFLALIAGLILALLRRVTGRRRRDRPTDTEG